MKKEKLESWFGGRIQQVLDDGSEYPIFLVAIGEKPGALTMNVDRDQEEALEGLTKDLGLALKVSEGRISKPGVEVGKRPEHDQRCAFIAQSNERFKILEESSGRFYGFSDEAVGKFLGFPESAISFFIEHEQPGMISKKGIKQKDPDNPEILGLTTFIPDPESLNEALETGKKRERQLERFDRQNQVSIGEDFIQKRKHNSLY